MTDFIYGVGSEGAEYDYDGEPELYTIDDAKADIKRILSKADLKGYYTDNKLNASFFDNINSRSIFFKLKNRDNIIRTNLEMKNVQTEYYVGLLLNNENIPTKRGFENFKSYVAHPIFIPALTHLWLNNLKFLNAERVERKRGRPRQIINPTTERKINIDGRTYKNIYGKIILKHATIKYIANLNTIDYEIKGNCVKSYISEYYSDKICKKYIPKEPTYINLLNMAKSLNINFYVKSITKEIIDCYKKKGKSKYDDLSIIISNEHMYVEKHIGRLCKKSEAPLENFKQLNKYENRVFYVHTPERFEDVKKYLNKENILSGYSKNEIKYKTNTIRYIDKNELHKIRKYKNILKINTDNIFSLMDNCFDLHGYINKDTYSIFKELNFIRVFKNHDDYTVKFDAVKCYASQLYDNIFPIPSINDYIEKYNNDEILDYGFYYCELKQYDSILAVHNSFYLGKIVKIMKKDGFINRITHKFIANNTRKVNKLFLPPETCDGECKDKCKCLNKFSFDSNCVNTYIGYLVKTVTEIDKNYDSIKGDELEALKLLHNDNFVRGDTFIRKYIYKKVKSGLFAWLSIIQLSNLQLYLFDKEFKKKNDCELVSIKTDCLAYLTKKDYKNPKNFIDKMSIGKFRHLKNDDPVYLKKKINDEKIKLVNVKFNSDIIKDDVTEYTNTNIIKLLKNKKSFILQGLAGLGKTYTLINTIIPYFKDNEINYILTSTTKPQANDLKNKCKEEVKTIQYFMNRKRSDVELKQYFKKDSYLIIDEAIQLSQMQLKLLEFYKEEYKINIIALVDIYQCVTDYYITEDGKIPYINTKFSHYLFDNNKVILEKHKNMRFDDDLYDLLQNIIKNWNDYTQIMRIIYEKINTTKKNKYDLCLSYTNKTRLALKNICKNSTTIHKIQGQTLENKFIIYDLNKKFNMPVEVIFTGISRARTIDQIRIYNGDYIFPEKESDSESDSESDNESDIESDAESDNDFDYD